MNFDVIIHIRHLVWLHLSINLFLLQKKKSSLANKENTPSKRGVEQASFSLVEDSNTCKLSLFFFCQMLTVIVMLVIVYYNFK